MTVKKICIYKSAYIVRKNWYIFPESLYYLIIFEHQNIESRRCSSTAKCGTKVSVIFRRTFGIFTVFRNFYLFITRFLANSQRSYAEPWLGNTDLNYCEVVHKQTIPVVMFQMFVMSIQILAEFTTFTYTCVCVCVLNWQI